MGAVSEETAARRMWQVFEPVHAVTYFAAECDEEYRAGGLKGFWMGYFAGRAAPMGAVAPAVATATFYNFAPKMAARALPDAWAFAAPSTVLDARLAGVDRAFDRVFGSGRGHADVVAAAALARRAAESVTVVGRPLAAANADLPWPDDPMLALWQATTVLREHRGDGHVAALVDAELDGCEAHVSMAGTGAVTREVLQPARGWSDEEWAAAEAALVDRGWVEGAGSTALTAEGAAARRRIEEATDRMAEEPWRRLGPEATDELRRRLEPLVARIAGLGLIPPVNPIGLPATS
ncbi:MAG: SCO6745 family protein [Acidimicrobiales bacterium]